MNERTEMKAAEKQDLQAPTRPETALRPAVDVYEDEKGITLVADLPGVSRERLEIRMEGSDLTIEGQAAVDMPEEMQALYADIGTTRYRRSFTLSNELQTEKASAELKDGVLTLHLPKRPEVQPRRIEVS